MARLSPQEMVGQLLEALCRRCGDPAGERIARLILGCVGQVDAQGGHIALVCRLASRLSDHVVPKTINNYCASGLSAVGEAVLRAQAGEPGLALAGGVESLSQVPFLADRGAYYHDAILRRKLRWTLPVMGAELIASLDRVSREDLDSLCLRSHRRAAAAWENGFYRRCVIAAQDSRGQVLLERDECVRPDLEEHALQQLPPLFDPASAAEADAIALDRFPELKEIRHVHTVAHCPGLADAASLVLVGPAREADALGLRPMARVLQFVEVTGDPVLQFGAGFTAMETVLARAGLRLQDIDRVEFMESFAATPLRFLRDHEVDPDRVNVHGGLVAIGHALGATGASLLTTLVHELDHCDGQLGLVVALAAGGIGVAMIIERV